jgi:tetratricopeptide (TPR) repeat protein
MTRSAEAYEFYLRGRDILFRYILHTHDEGELEEAIRMMHEAIGLDPEFARAHATLGRCYVMHAQGWGGAENYMLAERALKRALDLDPTIVNAHLQMVYVDLHHGDKQQTREGNHGDLIGKERNRPVRRQWTEVGRPLDERVLDDMLERALFFGDLVFSRGRLDHRIASLTSSGSSAT